MATLNQGVGGTPKIAQINKNGVRVLELPRARALANLSGAYLAEFSPRLAIDRTRGFFDEVLNKESPNYKRIAERAGIEPQTLTGIYVPYSSWQESANTRRFRTKPTER